MPHLPNSPGQRLLTILALAALLPGCASMSGLGGVTGYGCQAPRGSSCASLSAVYASSLPPAQAGSEVPAGPAITAAMPAHSAPRRMRIWLAPWVDQEGSLHDQSFLYVQLDSGRWLLDAQRESAASAVLQRLHKLPDESPAASTRQLPALPGPRAADAGAQR